MGVSPRHSFTIPLPGRDALLVGPRTLIMGVLNVTPDSFSDGGLAFEPAQAIDRAIEMEAHGADIVDVGAESSRPGAAAVSEDEEWRRLGPVLEGLSAELRVPVSVDTYRATTARRALAAGAAIINDISGLGYDPGLGAVVAASGAALVLMHTRGRSHDMYREARYGDVTGEITQELQQSMDRAIGDGVAWDRIVVDPGLGFAKHAAHSYVALARLEAFTSLGRPILTGPSRKSFLTEAAGGRSVAERDWATAAAVTAAILAGTHIVRVHNVADMRQVVRAADAIRDHAC